jgi:hypothetical protein
MRTLLVLLLLALPSVTLASTAHACATTLPTADGAGMLYLRASASARDDGPASVRSATAPVNVDVAVPDCDWAGPGVEVWRETNGQPGLQTTAASGCAPDLLVAGATAARPTVCRV